jgi:salicylate hydroxylase
MVQCIGTSVNRDTSGAKRIPIDRDYMEKAFASCKDGHVATGMIDVSSFLAICVRLLTSCV